ncbi:MAG: hypothetical protein AB1696_25325 [Planctomycetota bacterium]
MKRFILASLLAASFMLGGCFSPKIDLSGLDGLIKTEKKEGDKDKKEDKEKDEKKKKND